MQIQVEKWHAAGNDFLIVNPEVRAQYQHQYTDSELALKLCHRHYGIGADGLMFADYTPAGTGKAGTYFMTFYNSDGSVAEMCGNGLRCFCGYLLNHGAKGQSHLEVNTLAGLYKVEVLGSENQDHTTTFSIDMGRLDGLQFDATSSYIFDDLMSDTVLQGYYSHVGVPHLAVFKSVSDAEARALGSKIEKDPRFERGVNVNFIECVAHPDGPYLKVKTWERGAGLTLACGTGITASAFVAYSLGKMGFDTLHNRTDQEPLSIEVQAPGGTVHVCIHAGKIYLQGKAKRIAICSAFVGD